MVPPGIRNVEDVGNVARHGQTGHAARAPGLALPAGDGAVLHPGYLDLGEQRGPVARDGLLAGPVEPQTHRPSAGFLRQPGAHHGPRIRAELAAESAADVVHLHFDVGRRHFQGLPQFAGVVGDILRGGPHLDLVALPLNHLPVRFQAAVSDYGYPVRAFGEHLGFGERLVGIALNALAGLLRVGGRHLRQGGVLHIVRQHFVVHADEAHRLPRLLFGGSRHGRDFRALPLQLGAGLGDYVHRLHTLGFFRRAGVDAANARVGMRAGEVGAV